MHCPSLWHVVVSSDDDEILDVAKKGGCETLKRPPELASDEATSYPSIIHALDNFPGMDAVCLLQPTSPFRMVSDVETCVCTVDEMEIAAVVSVENGKRRPNGSIYVGRQDWLRESLAIGNQYPFDTAVPSFYNMPAQRSVDIDTQEDFDRAETLLANIGY
jgi:CMP-N-acetylneuraminic acid synthetase